MGRLCTPPAACSCCVKHLLPGGGRFGVHAAGQEAGNEVCQSSLKGSCSRGLGEKEAGLCVSVYQH